MNVIETHQLRKTFPIRAAKGAPAGTVEAVRDVSLCVREGEIFAFLGPNGAGKSTTLRMLTTLLAPTSGTAILCGCDLLRQAAQLRRQIGYVSQAGGSDGRATALQNLILQTRLFGAPAPAARARSAELLDALGLAEYSLRPARTLSGGQRRRLDLALALVHSPRLLFLDEPTSGLDPQARANLWEEIRRLRAAGTTVFLTTHYLDEADALADRLAILDYGTIVAEGTPDALKRQISGDTLTIQTATGGSSGDEALGIYLAAQPGVLEVRAQADGWLLRGEDGGVLLPQILRGLEERGRRVHSASLSKPSLDDVFLRQTGRSLREAGGMN